MTLKYTLAKIISFIGLALTIVPAFLVFNGTITLEENHQLMFLGTILWFLSASFWINKNS